MIMCYGCHEHSPYQAIGPISFNSTMLNCQMIQNLPRPLGFKAVDVAD